MATDPATAGIIAGAGSGIFQQQQQSQAASRQSRNTERSLDIQESEARDRGSLANQILEFISSSSAFDPTRARAEEGRILQTESQRQQDILGATQSLPGGGDPRDTVASEQRARLVAAQQDLQIRRNRSLDFDLLTGKLNALLATASIGGIRTPEFGSKSFRKRFAII